MSEIKTPIEFLNEEYLQELGNGSLSKHASWKNECGVLMSTYDAKQIIDYVNKLKEQNEKLKESLKIAQPYVEYAYHAFFPNEYENIIALDKIEETLKSCES